MRKHPHAVAFGRLGGLVRSMAEGGANRENSARAAWSKAAGRLSRSTLPGGLYPSVGKNP